jgi:cytosine/adenosine deaminase-related metal-dependent hydrolase
VVALAADHPALAERHGDALLDGWIFAAASPAISAVWAHGRQVVADGRHIARAGIAHAVRQALIRLLAQTQ